MIGFECTVGVDDVDAIAAAVQVHGGKVTVPPFVIEGVGTLVMLEDTEGNVLGAMRYMEGVR
ncbi:MAG: putative enzyme related to lactoylglutathione lyase [Pseudohongiellaceae bacterium]|jgi:predicted enzyme related to lactoylglutathione lyase